MRDADGNAMPVVGVTVDAFVRDVQMLAVTIEQVPKASRCKLALRISIAGEVGEQRHADYVDLRCQPSQSHTPCAITSSRSLPFSQGSSSVNNVTHCR